MASSPRSRIQGLWRRLGIPAEYAVMRGLAVQREATRLVSIGRNPDGRLLRLVPGAASAWRAMRGAAADDGIILVPISGFRSVRRQTRIIREKLAAGRAIDDILRSVAAPGCSEHHTGRALDIGSPEELELDEHFARTPAFRWLQRHAGEFGFRLSFPKNNPHGIVYEPWHWCWQRVKP
jgi:D-alanyl-D-alanine carboxypeptidase